MKLYIDCDPGTDDALALGYLLTRPDLDIVGIGSVAGNTSLEKVNRNLRLITSIFQPKLHIFKGSPYPIIENGGRNAESFHGTDGLGEFWKSDYYKTNSEEIENIISQTQFSDKSAVQEILELSKKYQGDLVIMALGPLTNIALAHLIDPEFGSRIKTIFIMGGNSFGPGNSPYYIGSEFNFSIDPESVHIVFNKISCPKIIYPLGVLGSPKACQINFDQWQKNEIFTNIIQSCRNRMCSVNYQGIIYDLVLAVILTHPEVVTKSQNRNVAIELNSNWNRGRIIINTRKDQEAVSANSGKFSSVSIIEELHEAKVIEILEKF